MVEEGNWPIDNAVPLDMPFEDKRGKIQNLILRPVTSVAVIESVAGTVRANHYHKTDWHYAYIVKGKIIYFEREVGSKVKPLPQIFTAGQMFFTPPMREHSMVFAEDTTFVTMAKNIRSHESHESDLVRVEFVDEKYINDIINEFVKLEK
jgi:dTDP-4-dehydrorhamnose 3,5-epimerase-like enzyme